MYNAIIEKNIIKVSSRRTARWYEKSLDPIFFIVNEIQKKA